MLLLSVPHPGPSPTLLLPSSYLREKVVTQLCAGPCPTKDEIYGTSAACSSDLPFSPSTTSTQMLSIQKNFYRATTPCCFK